MNSSSQEPEKIYNQLPCGHHSLDKNGNFVSINDIELQMLGYSREEVIGRNFTDFITPESLPTFDQNFAVFTQRGRVNNLEFQMRCKDGTILPVALSATAIKDEAGNFLMSNSIVVDLSGRQKLEVTLQKKEEQLRLALNLNHIGMWEWEISTGAGTWNDYNYLLFGYQPGEIEVSYELWRSHVHPDDITEVEQKVTQALATKSDYEGELRVVWRDGSIHWLRGQGKAIYDEAGQPVRMIGVSFDISDTKQQEAERQQLELSLRTSEAQLSRILDSAIAAISSFYVYSNRDWNYEYWSAGCERLYGYSLAELADKHFWLSQVNPEDCEQILMPLFEDFFAERDTTAEYRFRHKDGRIRWFSSAYTSRKIAEDCWIVTTVNYDITERKQAELALRQQIEREHLLAEITQAIHQTLDVKIVLQTVVDRVRQFLQTERVVIFRFHPDWSGKVVSESVASECTSILESEITDPCFEEKYVEPYRQGRVSWVSDFHSSEVEPCYQELMARFQVRANLVVPILQREHLWGLLIAHHCRAPKQWHSGDIELLQQLATQLGIAIQQAELYQKNTEQAALIDIASDAIFVRDLSNRILFWSQGAERLYGWQAEEVKNRIAQELFHQESLSQLEVALHTTIERGNWHGELKQLTKAGQQIIVSSRWTLMRDQQGHDQSILVVNTNITEKKQLEQQLLHAQRLESIGTLAGGLAHDLNNILTPILGLTQLLPLYIPNLDESSAEMLKIVRASALRGADIVRQVLLFARGTETKWELLSVAELIEETLKLIRETFPKSIAIEDYISPNLWLLEGDSTQLHQLLMNLCVNARDAMPDGGKLIISAENLSLDEQYSATNFKLEVGNYILITITDTGIGIPPEITERIFEPFFTTKEPGQGTGLGLSTAIGIVKNHGGTMELSSDHRTGTQFQIYLPVSESRATNETITDETISSGRGELILIVDDEAAIREVTQATLETHNYRVITASDGLEAIAIYAQKPHEIEVVLMDLIMPEMDGLTAMRALKKINPHVKLIATSGMATKEKVSAAESIGIQGFLLKPYTTEKLLLHLKQAIATE